MPCTQDSINAVMITMGLLCLVLGSVVIMCTLFLANLIDRK